MSDVEIKIGKSDALVIIDAQKDFINSDGAHYVAGVNGEPTAQEVVDRIVRLARLSFGLIVTTQDKHPFDDHIEYQIFGGKHCTRLTDGQKYHQDLLDINERKSFAISKGMHPALVSYTVATSPAFGDSIAELRRNEIKRIFLCGWAYTHCVGESAIDYARQGFEVYVLRDVTRSVPPPYGNPDVMDEKLRLYGVKLVYNTITPLMDDDGDD